jgi:hypothetical protein
MRSLLQKGYSNLNLFLEEARGAEKVKATELNADIDQTHFEKAVEALHIAYRAYYAEGTCAGDEPWILI